MTSTTTATDSPLSQLPNAASADYADVVRSFIHLLIAALLLTSSTSFARAFAENSHLASSVLASKTASGVSRVERGANVNGERLQLPETHQEIGESFDATASVLVVLVHNTCFGGITRFSHGVAGAGRTRFVLVDTNAIPALAKNPTLSGLLRHGEIGVASDLRVAEIAMVVGWGKLRGVPRAMASLPVWYERGSASTAVWMRGFLKVKPGSIRDGSLMAASWDRSLGLITADKEVFTVLRGLGGDARLYVP